MTTRARSFLDPYSALRRRVDADPSITPTGTPAPRVEGGFGRVAAAKAEINPNTPVPARKFNAREAQHLLIAELLAAARQLTATTTELSSQIGKSNTALNGIIGVTKLLITSDGYVKIHRPVTIGSAVILNNSANDWTVQLGPGSSDTAPEKGVGLFPIPAGAFIPVPIGQKAFTIFGTSGDSGGIQLFTGLQGYGAKA